MYIYALWPDVTTLCTRTRAYKITACPVLCTCFLCAAAGYLMRSNVSATAGVVVGVVCKIGSIILNLLIWSNHASPMQLCFLALGLAGGSLFQQAPLREKHEPKLPLAMQDMHTEPGLVTIAGQNITPALHATRSQPPNSQGV